MDNQDFNKELSELYHRQNETEASIARLESEVGNVISTLSRIENRLTETNKFNWAPLSIATVVIIAAISGNAYIQNLQVDNAKEFSKVNDYVIESNVKSLKEKTDNINSRVSEKLDRDVFENNIENVERRLNQIEGRFYQQNQ